MKPWYLSRTVHSAIASIIGLGLMIAGREVGDGDVAAITELVGVAISVVAVPAAAYFRGKAEGPLKW